MLELKNIKKSYKTGDFVQHALKGVDLSFRKNEFVAILGPSGSGKTTLLNVIGGLDHYDSGDLIINETSTKKYKDRDKDMGILYSPEKEGIYFLLENIIMPQDTILLKASHGMGFADIVSWFEKKYS